MDNVIWNKFLVSSEFSDLSDYPKKDVKFILGSFEELAQQVGVNDISKWDGELVFNILMAVGEQAQKDGDFQSFMTFMMFYDIVTEFLKFASMQGIIPITVTEMIDLLDQVQSELGLKNNPNTDSYAEPALPQWREYTANDIAQYSQSWVESYITSPDWKYRSKGVTNDIVTTAMSALTDQAYNEYRKTPKSWTKKAIHGVLTGYFVSNIGFDAKDYQHIVPALTGLLTFVGKKGWINQTKVDNYQRFLAASEDEMIELASDSSNYSSSKTLVTKMMEQDIDLNDESAVNDFINQVNANGGIDSLREDNVDNIPTDSNVISLDNARIVKGKLRKKKNKRK